MLSASFFLYICHPDGEEMRPYVHRVKYYECDGMGVTHHSNYIRFMEEARVDMQDQLGYGYDKMEADGILSPVVSVECEYKRPTRFQDDISIELRLAGLSPLKVRFAYTMRVGDKVVCTAGSTHCFLDRNGRPVSLMDRCPELLRRMQEELGG